MPPFQDVMGSDIADFLFRLGLERLGLEAVEDWPNGFHREIDNMRERWGGDARMSL